VSTTTIVFAFAISHLIGRPLRQLALGARRIGKGVHGIDIDVAGPQEIRQAAMAINEASRNLKLAERQATALSKGDLNDPALSQQPSSTNTSLQAAVEALASSISNNDEYRDRLAHEATHDDLTGLTNRPALLMHLAQALARVQRSRHELAVLFLDLDGFKQVNDTYGHAAGDHVLVTTASRLLEVVRSSDLVGRLGGDEFLIISEPIRDSGEASKLADRIIGSLNSPIDIGATTVTVGVSIGIAVSTHRGRTVSEILASADQAMYAAKLDGKNTSTVEPGISRASAS